MELHERVPLSSLTTFRLGGPADFLASVSTVKELAEAIHFAEKKRIPWIALGGGSNILFPDEGFHGVVIRMNFTGLDTLRAGETTIVSAGAGEVWDDLAGLSVSLKLYGIENLSGIPGSVGGAPIQNIGAYGAELADSFRSAEVYDAKEKKIVVFDKQMCRFGYRDSIFKRSPHLIVTKVTLRLAVEGYPNLSYPDVRRIFPPPRVPSLAEIRTGILNIRATKLPDVKNTGTAGSFFKNPIVLRAEYARIAKRIPDIPLIPLGNSRAKIPAGWLLDKIGTFKGAREGGARVWEQQALVIVNDGGTTADVVTLARRMREKIASDAGITLVPEVATPGISWKSY